MLLRNRLVIPVLVSAVLHLGLVLWLVFRAPDFAPAPSPTPVDEIPVELVFVEPSVAVERKPEAPRAHQKRPAVAPRTPSRTDAPSVRSLSGSPQESDVPVVPPAGASAPSLEPRLPSSDLGVAAYAAPRERQSGKTSYPTDPEFSPEVRALEERHRVQARVEAFIDDSVAEVRALRAPRHPYLQDVADSVGALARIDGGTPAQLGVRFAQNLLKQYFDAAESYGRTGNPGIGLGTPGQGPSHSEQLSALTKDDPSLLMLRMQVQAREHLQAVASKGPLFTVRVELNQDRTGSLTEVTLLEGSGNARFDAFILRAMPEAVGRAGLPPSELLKGNEVFRTQWQVEGWLKASNKTLEKLSLYGFNPMGLPLDQLVAALNNDNARIEYRARLLRAY